MRHFFPVAALAAALVYPATAATDRSLLALLPPDSKTVVAADIATLRSTSAGRQLLAAAELRTAVMEAFERLSGLQLSQDVQSLVTVQTATNPPGHLVVFMRGALGRAEVREAIAKNFPETEMLAGTQIQTHRDHGTTLSIAFLKPTVAILGNLELVKRALMARNLPATLDGGLLAEIQAVSAVNDVWYASSEPGLPITRGTLSRYTRGIDVTQMLRTIQHSGGGLHVGSQVTGTLQATTDTPEDAASLRDVFKFAANMLAAQNSGPANGSMLAVFLRAANVSSSGPVFLLNGTVTDQQFSQFLHDWQGSRPGVRQPLSGE